VYKDNDIYIYVSAVKKNSSDTLLPCWWNVSEDVWFHMTRKRQLKRIEWKAGEREREGWQKKRRYACCFAFGSMKTDIYFSSKMAHLHSFQPTDKQVGENLEFAAPSVCRNEKDGRARKSAEERAGPIRGANPWRQTSVPLRSSSWRYSFVGPLRYHIIHTREEFRNDWKFPWLNWTQRSPVARDAKTFYTKVNDLKASLRKPDCTPDDALSSNLNRKGSNALHALYWCWGWTKCSNGKSSNERDSDCKN